MPINPGTMRLVTELLGVGAAFIPGGGLVKPAILGVLEGLRGLDGAIEQEAATSRIPPDQLRQQLISQILQQVTEGREELNEQLRQIRASKE